MYISREETNKHIYILQIQDILYISDTIHDNLHQLYLIKVYGHFHFTNEIFYIMGHIIRLYEPIKILTIHNLVINFSYYSCNL